MLLIIFYTIIKKTVVRWINLRFDIFWVFTIKSCVLTWYVLLKPNLTEYSCDCHHWKMKSRIDQYSNYFITVFVPMKINTWILWQVHQMSSNQTGKVYVQAEFNFTFCIGLLSLTHLCVQVTLLIIPFWEQNYISQSPVQLSVNKSNARYFYTWHLTKPPLSSFADPPHSLQAD